MAINLVTKYLPILDAIYKKQALTAPLEVNPDNIRFIGANIIELFNMQIDGMGNYSRTNGFVSGDVGNTWTPYTLTQDRGRSFVVDTMDNEETMGMLFGKLAGEFFRTKVIPEMDAYRFAKLAATSGILSATAADITVGTTDVAGMIDEAEEAMGDEEVPTEGKLLYVSELAYRALKAKITRMLMNENGVNTEVEVFNNMVVRRVPKGRFCTGITMLDGTTSGQLGGGYKFTKTTSKPINFMIVHPSAVAAVMKHATNRLFTPDVNQDQDAWKYQYRVYHDIFVEANKVKGIYLSTASTGLAADIVG